MCYARTRAVGSLTEVIRPRVVSDASFSFSFSLKVTSRYALNHDCVCGTPSEQTSAPFVAPRVHVAAW
jgi:hypothetical protein